MLRISILACLAVALCSAQAATFTINPAQSSVTLSGSVSGITMNQQGPGSLTTRLEGMLELAITGSQVTLTGGTVDAQTNGVWQPGPGGTGDPAPADFGAQGSSFLGPVLGATRDIVLNVSSPTQPLEGNQFDASSLVFAFPEGSSAVLDFDAGFAGSGSRSLAGQATNRTATVGTITGSAGSRTVNVAMDATFTFSVLQDSDTMLRVQGQIVAYEGSGPAPQNPIFTGIEVVNNEVRLTVDAAAANAILLASTNLMTWTQKAAQVTVVDSDTRRFTVPVSGPKEFYRLQQ